MNSAITLVPPPNVLFTVAAEHLQTLLHKHTHIDHDQKSCFQKDKCKYTHNKGCGTTYTIISATEDCVCYESTDQ